MATHQHKGMTFDLPDRWVDRTVVAFSAPPQPDIPKEHLPNVVMTREALAEGDTLRTHADKTLLEMAKQLDGFDILESRETLLAGLRAVHIRFKWTSSFGELEQAMTMCEAPPEPDDTGRFATLITTSAHAKVAAQARPVFEQVLSSFRFTNPGGSLPPGGGRPAPSLAPEPPPLPESPVFGSRRR
jgi:hypothetical protein